MGLKSMKKTRVIPCIGLVVLAWATGGLSGCGSSAPSTSLSGGDGGTVADAGDVGTQDGKAPDAASDAKADTTSVDVAPQLHCKDPLVDCPKPKACEQAVCRADGGCGVQPVAAGTVCDDQDQCTKDEHCNGTGKCKGTVLNCDDGNECTSDGCSPQQGCTHANWQKPCSQTGPCMPYACKAGICQAAGGSPCDDGNPCTTELCDPKVGCQYNVIAMGPCDDGNPCTQGDVCKFGVCKGKGKQDCDDGNPCTTDTCDLAGDCTHIDAAIGCNDGDPCTTVDTCVAGNCKGISKACDDSDPCTVDQCDPVTGVCMSSPAVDGTVCTSKSSCVVDAVCTAGICQGQPGPCDDGNACTSDSCGGNGCDYVSLPDTTTCTDDGTCTASASCQAGSCTAIAKVCLDENPCTTDACDLTSGECVHPAAADGTPCGEGQACSAGTCQ